VTNIPVALIGAGLFGQKHVETLASEPTFKLVAIADPTPAAADYARQCDVPCFADYRDMLDKAKPAAAIIATPNVLHVPTGLACVERGVHVLVEKPIADTVEDAQKLARAAERAGVALLVGHHRRYNPIIEKAREIVQGGQIGRLTAVVGLWLVLKPDAYFEAAHRRQPGAGPVLTNCIHDIDDLRFICGEITDVQAFTSNAVREFAVEDTAAVCLRFGNGALGTITVSDTVAAPWSWELTSGENPAYSRSTNDCYLLAGTEGSLTVPRLELSRYEGERGWYAPLSSKRIDVEYVDPLVTQMRHFARVIQGQERPRITGADATRTLAVTVGIHQAAASGRPVVIE
jgi:predicted dehydrogenase